MEPQNQSCWRLLVSGNADGYTNMAADEAIVLAHARGLVPPTLRFYGWRPYAVSLGYHQRATVGIDVQACQSLGFDLVRRPTGGRAILHEDEVTFSVSVLESLVPGDSGVMSSYRWISSGILEGLRLLGVDAEMARGESKRAGEGRAAACFKSAALCDVVVGGRKIVGSAQVRREGAILQQTSLPVEPDGASRDRVFRESIPWDSMIPLNEALGRPVSIEEAIQALSEGFRKALGIRLEPGTLSSWEKSQIGALLEGRYRRDEWNLEGVRREIS